MSPPIHRTTDGTAEFTRQTFTARDIWRDVVTALRPSRRPSVPTTTPTAVDPFARFAWPAEVQ